jgi:hypothetical protein
MEFVEEIKHIFKQNLNPSQAEPMKKYMKGKFEFLGINYPELIPEYTRKWMKKGIWLQLFKQFFK